MPALTEWDSFYVIVGAAAGGLIGLQFVVLTLIAQDPPEGVAEAGAAFASPTIVHFGGVLLLSALIQAPWHTLAPALALLAVIGAAGLFYTLVVARRMFGQTAYTPQFEDLFCHILMPIAAYALLAAAPLMPSDEAEWALFGVGAAALLLLFAGIHNAWDTVAYHVFTNIIGKKNKGGPVRAAQAPKRSKR